MLQKLTIIDIEKKEIQEQARGNEVKDGIDNVNSGKSYKKCKWWMGFFLIVLNSLT